MAMFALTCTTPKPQKLCLSITNCLNVCEHLLCYAIEEGRTRVNILLSVLKAFSETLLHALIPESSFLFDYFLAFDTNICMIQDPFSLGAEPSLSNIGLCCLTVSYLVHVCLFIFVRRIQPLTRILGDGVEKKPSAANSNLKLNIWKHLFIKFLS